MIRRTNAIHGLGSLIILLSVALFLGACGGGAANTATAGTGVSSAAPAAQSEQGGGDAPLTTFTDPGGQFRFQYPQTWGKTTQSGESIRFTGADEFISITITTTTQTPIAFAQADAAAIAAASPGFKGTGVKAYKVAGTNGSMVAYTWQLPKSAVSGKPVPSSGNRYYIPGPGGKIAIFTYSSPTRTYDPAGADDFANAFTWL